MTAIANRIQRTDLSGLEALALGQGGYFDRRDAHGYGITDSLLRYHTRTGRFERILPGVYRLRVAPISPYDEYLLAWVWTNNRGAISHESALALYDLADILPARVHVTAPRPFHRTSAPFHVHLAPLPEQSGAAMLSKICGMASRNPSGILPDDVLRGVHAPRSGHPDGEPPTRLAPMLLSRRAEYLTTGEDGS